MTIHDVENDLAGAEIYCRKCNKPMKVPKLGAALSAPPQESGSVADAIEIVDTPKEKPIRPVISKPPKLEPVGFLIWGWVLLLVGIGMLVYFGACYDTAIQPTDIFQNRVHNIGLMNNRLVGMIGGGAFSLIGVVLLTAYAIITK